ncbi:MAG: two pore domain potassium channel family protein [Bacteroidetes bacterium]|nr:MAG: two pore domain potassium channel family protein [Bacteroidota bacterium]
MRLSIKARTILWFLIFFLCVYAVLILFFAYLYFSTNSIGYYKFLAGGDGEIDFFRAVYFSVVSFHTIGYGDIYPITMQGRVIMMIQAFFSLFYTAVFSGMLVYFIIRRHPDIITTKHLYVRFRHNNWYLSARLGNKGRPIIDLKGRLEAWLINENSRIRVFSHQMDLADLEYILYFDIDLEEERSKPLQQALLSSLNGGPVIHMKYNLIGNDLRSGEQIAHSVYYDSTMIRFGTLFQKIYSWDKAGHRVNFRWNHFEHIAPLDEELTSAFKAGNLKHWSGPG